MKDQSSRRNSINPHCEPQLLLDLSSRENEISTLIDSLNVEEQCPFAQHSSEERRERERSAILKKRRNSKLKRNEASKMFVVEGHRKFNSTINNKDGEQWWRVSIVDLLLPHNRCFHHRVDSNEDTTIRVQLRDR